MHQMIHLVTLYWEWMPLLVLKKLFLLAQLRVSLALQPSVGEQVSVQAENSKLDTEQDMEHYKACLLALALDM